MTRKRSAAAVFVHGLAKKPAPKELLKIWLWGLGRGNPMPTVFPPPNEGIDLVARGVPHVLDYYADVFYGDVYDTDLASYEEADDDDEMAYESLDRVEEGLALAAPETERERKFVAAFEGAIVAGMTRPVASFDPGEVRLGVPPGLEFARLVPPVVREAIVKKAAMEAYYYLFNKEFVRADGARFQVREELRKRLLVDLGTAAGLGEKVVLVTHSMGTIVAYDVLRNCPSCPPVDTLITLGSPLGVREVQQELLATGRKHVDFPSGTLRRWVNIYDPLDPICGADPIFANDFAAVDEKTVEDVRESNWGKWRHSISHYLAGTVLRRELAAALEI